MSSEHRSVCMEYGLAQGNTSSCCGVIERVKPRSVLALSANTRRAKGVGRGGTEHVRAGQGGARPHSPPSGS